MIHLKESCPACGHVMEGLSAPLVLTGDPVEQAAVEATIKQPRPGDITICRVCVAALEFGPDLGLVRLDYKRLSPIQLLHTEALRFRIWSEVNPPAETLN